MSRTWAEHGAAAPAELWTAQTSAAADRYTMDVLGVPSPLLMERAALCVAHEVATMRAGTGLPVLVLCGPGNNGGDGLALARQLCGWELPVSAVLVSNGHGAAVAEQLRIARAFGVTVHERWPSAPAQAIVVDALLGTGSRGAPRDAIADALRKQRAITGLRVAIDLPSGIDPDTGVAFDDAFVADVTVTFVRSKPGLHVMPGRAHAGRIVVGDIGLSGPPDRDRTHALIDPAFVAMLLGRLPAATHKGQRGHVAILGGSAGTPGAAVLAGAAALRAGAGLVTIATRDAAVQAQLVQHRPELMVAAYDEGALVPVADALVVGPGLTDPRTHAGLASLWRSDPRPALWDASALDHVPAATPPGGPRIVTPHPGEAARMLARRQPDGAWTSAKVQAQRMDAATRLAKDTDAIVVLKGEGTIVALPEGTVAINVSGSAALATAGSGDVLSGLGGALMARGLDASTAARAAVYLHGRAGEIAPARTPGPVALDIADATGVAMSLAQTEDDHASWPRWRRG